MQAGKLDRRIVIERATETRDALNNVVRTWATHQTVWAEKKDVSDRERFGAQAVSAEITTRFRIRYSSDVSDVNAKDRIVYDGETYDIIGVKEIGRREGLEITTGARTD